MNKKLLKALLSITCGLGIVGTIPTIASSCGRKTIFPKKIVIKTLFPMTIYSRPGEKIKQTQDLSGLVYTDTGVKLSGLFEFTVSNELPDGLSIDKNTGIISGTCNEITRDFSFKIFVNAIVDGKNLFGQSPIINLFVDDADFSKIEIRSEFSNIIGNVDTKIKDTNDLSNSIYTNSGYKITDNFTFKLISADGTDIPNWIKFNTKTGQIFDTNPTSKTNIELKIMVSATIFGKELVANSPQFFLKIYEKNILPYECYDIQNGAINGFSKDFDTNKYPNCNTIQFPSCVTKISPSASFQNIKYDKLTILDLSMTSIDSIPASEFLNNYYINTILFPNSLVSIGDEAFSHCSNILSINLSKCQKLSILSEASFEYCTSLSDVSFPNSIIQIGLACFSGCKKIGTIDLSSCFNLKILPSAAFYACTSLLSLLLPSSIETIGSACFDECYSLTEVDLSSLNNLGLLGQRALGECNSLKMIKLPQSLKKISGYCFINDPVLSNITWDGIKSLSDINIGVMAFSNISNEGKVCVTNSKSCTATQLLNWLQGKDIPSTGIKGAFPGNGWIPG